MLTNFNYNPLKNDEIRLIHLASKATRAANSGEQIEDEAGNGTDEGHLQCGLQPYKKSGRPEYIALSYTWGNQQSEKKVVVEGQHCYITPTVEEALRRLQSERVETLVWIDQICINQADDVEKSHHVQQMRFIYSEAAEVVVWLGPDADNCGRLFHHLQESLDAFNAKDYATLFSLYSDEQHRTTIAKAWRGFCERSYWKRLWVIQEYALAPKGKLRVACGAAIVTNFITTHPLVLIQRIQAGKIEVPERFQTGDLGTVIVNMYRIPATSFMEGIITRRQRYYYNVGKGVDYLFRLLVTTLALEMDYNRPQSSEPRDQIFAVLQLADDADELRHVGFQVDYQKSCEEVYVGAALAMLKQGHVDVLSYCQFPKEITSLPSWVPDWSMKIRTPCASSPWINSFSASGHTASSQKVRGGRCQGNRFSGFCCRPSYENWVSLESALAKTHQPLCRAGVPGRSARLLPTSPRIPEDEVSHATARIAVQDVPRRIGGYYADWPNRIQYSYLQAIQILSRSRQQPANTGQPTKDTLGLQEDSPGLQGGSSGLQGDTLGLQEDSLGQQEDTLGLQEQLYLRLLRGLHSRRPFISSTGYVGLCPRDALPNDQICVFFGSKIAYIVRPQSGRSFELVGEAYVHGIMHGELLNDLNEVEAREFVIG